MITPVPLSDGTQVRYAMGVTHYEHATGRVIEHGGGIDGFLSHSRYYPDQDVTVVVLQNTAAPPGPAAIANQIGELLFGTPGALEAQSFSGDLSRFSGNFHGPARGTELDATVTSKDGKLNLVIQAGSNSNPVQTPIYIGGNTFAQGDVRYTFEMTSDGASASVLRMDSPSSHYVLTAVRNLND